MLRTKKQSLLETVYNPTVIDKNYLIWLTPSPAPKTFSYFSVFFDVCFFPPFPHHSFHPSLNALKSCNTISEKRWWGLNNWYCGRRHVTGLYNDISVSHFEWTFTVLVPSWSCIEGVPKTPVGGKVHAMNWHSLWMLHWHRFPNQCTHFFRLMWLNVGCWQSSANSLGRRCSWIQPFAPNTHVIPAEITMWGGLKWAHKGQQKRAWTNAVKSHSKVWFISAELERERMAYFFVTFPSAVFFAWLNVTKFLKSAIWQLLLVYLRHSQDYKYISDSCSLIIFIVCIKTHCSYT